MVSRFPHMLLSPPVSPGNFNNDKRTIENINHRDRIDRARINLSDNSAFGHADRSLADRQEETRQSHNWNHSPPAGGWLPESTFAYGSNSFNEYRTSETTGNDYRPRSPFPDALGQRCELSEEQLTPESSRQSRQDAEDSTEDGIDDIEEETNEAELTPAERRAMKRKMKRFRLTHSQTRYLMNEFAQQAHPDAAHRERLSREIPGLSPRQVQVWFQNRRAKLKRLTAEDQERMMKSRTLPANFDMTQALHSSYSVQPPNMGMNMPTPSYLPFGSSHPMRPVTGMVAEFNPNNQQYAPVGNPEPDMSPYSMSGSSLMKANTATSSGFDSIPPYGQARRAPQDSPMQISELAGNARIALSTAAHLVQPTSVGDQVRSEMGGMDPTSLTGVATWSHPIPGSQAQRIDRSSSSRGPHAFDTGASASSGHARQPAFHGPGSEVAVPAQSQYARAGEYYSTPSYENAPAATFRASQGLQPPNNNMQWPPGQYPPMYQ